MKFVYIVGKNINEKTTVGLSLLCAKIYLIFLPGLFLYVYPINAFVYRS